MGSNNGEILLGIDLPTTITYEKKNVVVAAYAVEPTTSTRPKSLVTSDKQSTF